MTLSKSHRYFTPESYLELERISPIKHEYLQGQIVAMAGASKAQCDYCWKSLSPPCQSPSWYRLHFLCDEYKS
jgi:hypothetical protein